MMAVLDGCIAVFEGGVQPTRTHKAKLSYEDEPRCWLRVAQVERLIDFIRRLSTEPDSGHLAEPAARRSSLTPTSRHTDRLRHATWVSLAEAVQKKKPATNCRPKLRLTESENDAMHGVDVLGEVSLGRVDLRVA
jgi:hypothetical protein